MLEHFRYTNAIYALFAAHSQNPTVTHDFNLPENALVLDAGAYVGDWCVQVADCSPASTKIHAFEPGPPHVQQLITACEDLPNINIHQEALGGTSSTASLSYLGPGSTLYDYSTATRSVEVKVRDIGEVLDELLDGTSRRLDLLKLNVEGGEYEILERILELDRLGSIEHLLIQFHDWLPAATRKRWSLRRQFKKTHELVWDFPWIWEYWRRHTHTA